MHLSRCVSVFVCVCVCVCVCAFVWTRSELEREPPPHRLSRAWSLLQVQVAPDDRGPPASATRT
eukprot:873216-Rhodomonas_salina.3